MTPPDHAEPTLTDPTLRYRLGGRRAWMVVAATAPLQLVWAFGIVQILRFRRKARAAHQDGLRSDRPGSQPGQSPVVTPGVPVS